MTPYKILILSLLSFILLLFVGLCLSECEKPFNESSYNESSYSEKIINISPALTDFNNGFEMGVNGFGVSMGGIVFTSDE